MELAYPFLDVLHGPRHVAQNDLGELSLRVIDRGELEVTLYRQRSHITELDFGQVDIA